MRQKKINKKLTLNKETIATLAEEQMKRAKGGVSRTCGTHFCYTLELTCDSCINSECACSNPCIEF
jgi:natural product precursor